MNEEIALVANYADAVSTLVAVHVRPELASLELNKWVLHYPYVKLVIPAALLITIMIVEKRGWVMRGTSKIASLLLSALFAAATINNIAVVMLT